MDVNKKPRKNSGKDKNKFLQLPQERTPPLHRPMTTELLDEDLQFDF